MIKLLWCSCIFMIWKNRLFPQNRKEQNKNQNQNQNKLSPKGLGQRLDATPKEAVRAPGSTFQKVAFWRPTRVK